MTFLLDKFFISIGLEAQEIHESSIRSAIYIGIVFLLGLASAFLIMATVECIRAGS